MSGRLIGITLARQLSNIGWRRGVVVVISLAIAARIGIVLYANSHAERFDYPDSRRYAQVAGNIAMGRGPIETPQNRTGTDPLYPALLSLAHLGGPAANHEVYKWARVLNAALGLAALAAVMSLARRISGDLAGLIAGLIFAVDPILLFFHALVLTEIPFTTFLWIALYLMYLNRDRPSPLRGVAAGALLGCAALTRGGGLALALALPWLALIGGTTPRWRRVVVASFTTAATLIALYPASVRNHRLIGSWLPISTGGGATLLDSFGPWATGGSAWERIDWPTVPPDADEAARDQAYRDVAWQWIRENPGEAARLAWEKFKRTWSIHLNAPGYTGWTYSLIGWCTVAPVYVLAFIGGRRLRGRGGELFLLLAPALYITLLHMIFIGSVRYRVPAMPGLFILAAVAAAKFLERRAGAREPFTPEVT